jgi:hypothetical protein
VEIIMLEAKPIGIFSRNFGIEAGGQRIAMLAGSWWREAGEVSIEGQPYRFFREGLMSGDFILEKEGQVVARAVKPSAFSSRFDVELKDRRYSLKRASTFGRAFSVVQDEVVVGSIRRTGWFTGRTIIDLPSDWAVPNQIFAFWLVLIIWKRDDSAASG